MAKYLKRSNSILIVILIVSFLLRVWGINFGFPFFLHPDETKIVEKAITMAFGFKEAIFAGDLKFFDPNFYFYPSFLTYLLMFNILGLKVIFLILKFLTLGKVTFALVSKPLFYFLARLISVLFGTATIYLTYLLGKRISGNTVGLIAALILGTNFFHALNSHYYTGDVGATFFTVLSFLFIFMYLDRVKIMRAGWRNEYWVYLAALSIGFGAATKYYPVLMLAILVISVFLVEPDFAARVRKVITSVLISLATFMLIVPFSVFNFSAFIDELKESSARSATGVFGFTSDNFFHYLTSTEPTFIEPIAQNSLLHGLGLVFMLLFLASLGLLPAKKNKKVLLLIIYVLGHYLFFAHNLTKILRWLLPLAPLGSVLVAILIVELGNKLVRIKLWLVGGVLLAIIIPNLYRTILVDDAFTKEDTRVQLYHWVENHIPENSRIVFEYFNIAQFTRRDLYYFEFDHPRYNINGEIAASRPPDYLWLKNVYQPEYIVINGSLRDRYKQKSMQKLFPETCSAWLEIYDNIHKDYQVAVRFRPSFPDRIMSGPEMIVYVPRK